MIPKVIHYCWFGGKKIPKMLKKCMKSWKKYCPDYQIIEWNENNFNINEMPQYVRDAYEAKKWAFVTDYARLWIVYHYGGIYLDTDVELIKPLDALLCYNGFFGFENHDYKTINTGLGFGAEKGLKIVADLMMPYDTQKFVYPDLNKGEFVPNTWINWPVFEAHGVIKTDVVQIIDHKVAVFPGEYFDPMIGYLREEICITKNTYSIHHYSMTWDDNHEKKVRHEKIQNNIVLPMKRFWRKALGNKLYDNIKKMAGRNIDDI